MDLKLNDKTAFITGSSQGIGYSTALNLLKEGATVYINGTDTIKLENAVKLESEKLRLRGQAQEKQERLQKKGE